MKDFLEDVPSDPSPDTVDDTDIVDDVEDLDSREGADPAAEGEDEGDDAKPGRTIENVYRELSRKQEEFQQRMMERMMDSQQKLVDALRVKPEPEKKTGNTLDDMSVSELENFRAQVAEQNPDKIGEFDVYLNKRRVDSAVESRMSDWESRQKQSQLRSQAQQDALRRYPELANRGSEFYATVNGRLNELGDSYVQANPRAVLDAANDVAAELGVAPRSGRTGANIRGRVARKSNANPNPKANEPDEKSSMSKDELAKITERLKGAMPKGKKFDDKAIQEKAKFYRDNLQYYLRG